MRMLYRKWKYKCLALFRKPIFLPPISRGWPPFLVEGDYYLDMFGQHLWEIRDGYWQKKSHGVQASVEE